jgi:hypothetical protein
MKKAPLDELYFPWLYGQVASVETSNPERTYWRLLKLLYTKEFFWSRAMSRDENRAEDGKDLRHEFVKGEGLRNVDDGWLNLGCSILELMIGMARRMAFDVGETPRYWFWRMMENLEFVKYTDSAPYDDEEIIERLNDIIERRYDPDGRGGLFPLSNPDCDQRNVELWYQMQSYLLEM